MSKGSRWVVGALFLICALGCGSAQQSENASSMPVSADSAASAGEPSAIANGSAALKEASQGVEVPARQFGGAPAGPGAPVRATPVSVIKQRSIIRKADLAVRVENVEKAEKAVGAIAESLGGYVDSAASTDLSSDHPSISLTLRVPAASFETALSRFEALGVRLSKSISSEDVTGQIVDLDARLKTLSATEETYRNLLRDTHNMENIIQLQDKLTEVRSEIESMTAQRKALAGQASLSTITLRLEQSAIPAQAPRDPNWMAQTWGESTSLLGAWLRGFASVGIWALVFSPLWLPVLWIARKLTRTAKPGSSSLAGPMAPPPVH